MLLALSEAILVTLNEPRDASDFLSVSVVTDGNVCDLSPVLLNSEVLWLVQFKWKLRIPPYTASTSTLLLTYPWVARVASQREIDSCAAVTSGGYAGGGHAGGSAAALSVSQLNGSAPLIGSPSTPAGGLLPSGMATLERDNPHMSYSELLLTASVRANGKVGMSEVEIAEQWAEKLMQMPLLAHAPLPRNPF